MRTAFGSRTQRAAGVKSSFPSLSPACDAFGGHLPHCHRSAGCEIICMNKLQLKGDWNIAKGKLKQRWGKLTDDDLRYQEGMEHELVGRIQKRTGETQEAVEKAIEEAFAA
jgi:uncharacterized protein YjbJ (UPF0337 family)